MRVFLPLNKSEKKRRKLLSGKKAALKASVESRSDAEYSAVEEEGEFEGQEGYWVDTDEADTDSACDPVVNPDLGVDVQPPTPNRNPQQDDDSDTFCAKAPPISCQTEEVKEEEEEIASVECKEESPTAEETAKPAPSGLAITSNEGSIPTTTPAVSPPIAAVDTSSLLQAAVTEDLQVPTKASPPLPATVPARTGSVLQSAGAITLAPPRPPPPPPTLTLTETPACTTSHERRSLSPFDCKPASKNIRDCKPAARETARKPEAIANTKVVAAAAEAAAQPYAQPTLSSSHIELNLKMAGGSSSRKAHWNAERSSPSYSVENYASSATASNGSSSARLGDGLVSDHNSTGNEDINAPLLDIRFSNANNSYCYENDPASARGDLPAASGLQMISAASATAAATIPSSAVASVKQLRHLKNGDDDVRDTMIASIPQQQQEEEQQKKQPQVFEAEHDQFVAALKKQGLEIVQQEGDGNCLFRSISLQVYGDSSAHLEVRHRCLDFMARDKEHFSQFITDEPFDQYIGRKRKDGVHGNNPEIQAISELFNRPIEVYVPENGGSPLNIFHAEYKTSDAPIRLSYHDGSHYNAVIDPLVPTAGLGLGLPGLQPGLADKMQMAKAVRESDRLADQSEFERALEESQNDQLQRVIKESSLSEDHMFQNKAMSLSDCDATNFELEQAVLESSLESFRTLEDGQKKASSSGKTAGERRKRQSSPPQQEAKSSTSAAVAGPVVSSVASMPPEARQESGSCDSIPAAASLASAASSVAAIPAAASRPSSEESSSHAYSEAAAAPMMAEHYPQSVQELVMNGFDLKKVVHAYELVGDNFDNLLGFLMSTSGS